MWSRRVRAGTVSTSSKSQMYPSSFRTCAIPRRRFDEGISTRGRSIRTALRIRVSRSAGGGRRRGGIVGGGGVRRTEVSVPRRLGASRDPHEDRSLPTGLLDARDQAAAGQVPEADPADAEFAIDGAGASAELAAAPVPDRELAGRLRLDHLGLGGHGSLAVTWGERGPRVRVGAGSGQRPPAAAPLPGWGWRKGMPKDRRSSRACSSLSVVVTIVMSIPCVCWIRSASISGKTTCSARPSV